MVNCILCYFLIFIYVGVDTYVLGYQQRLYDLVTIQVTDEASTCNTIPPEYPSKLNHSKTNHEVLQMHMQIFDPEQGQGSTGPKYDRDPLQYCENLINQVLYGTVSDDIVKIVTKAPAVPSDMNNVDLIAQAPSGTVMRGELFMNRSSCHLPGAEQLHRGHCFLQLSYDYMQTALNAFAIFLHGDVDDILRLPRDYVLRSARTIAMMKIAKEKLTATWYVVKGDEDPLEISEDVLEYYRPLFQYLSGREMAKLNLSNPKILSYIGTHADLDRHQMGVVASKYIHMNPDWRSPKYLNLMNNLLCGVPMTFMRRVPENTYLQLSNQLFFHIRACDPLQRRFYLAMMCRTQVLGKSNSWRARDVARLGLLLTEVDGPELSAINPEAFVGFSAHVMAEMSASNLVYITDKQLQYLLPKVRNILANKIKYHFEEIELMNSGYAKVKLNLSVSILIRIAVLYVYVQFGI